MRLSGFSYRFRPSSREFDESHALEVLLDERSVDVLERDMPAGFTGSDVEFDDAILCSTKRHEIAQLDLYLLLTPRRLLGDWLTRGLAARAASQCECATESCGAHEN